MTAPTLCVYCASRLGEDPTFAEAAAEVGDLMAARGIDLVYGGGQVGLMGIVADRVMAEKIPLKKWTPPA